MPSALLLLSLFLSVSVSVSDMPHPLSFSLKGKLTVTQQAVSSPAISTRDNSRMNPVGDSASAFTIAVPTRTLQGDR